MSVFVDTSGFYAVLDRSDAEHAHAAEKWTSLVQEQQDLVTSNYIVVEACALVQHRLGVVALRAFIQDVLSVVRVEWVSPNDHARATAALLAATRRKLSLVDCTSFELMRRLGARKVLAFDKHFRDAGFEPA